MVWTTNNGIHFFRRPSQLHPSLFLSSWYSSSLARSKRSKRAWAQYCIQNTSIIIFQILFFMAVLVPLGKSQDFSPLNVRIDPRVWTLHVDEAVGKKIATIYVSGGNGNPISFSVESTPQPILNPSVGLSSSYDWSSFFKVTRRNNGNGIVRLKKSLEGAFQPGQEVEISIVVSQEGNDFVYRHNLHVEFDDPLREVIEYETDPESETNTTLRPIPLSTVTPRQVYSSQSESSQNSTKEPTQNDGTNLSNNQRDAKSDTMATIYAGIVIGIIILVVIALMMYLSRKKLRPWLYALLYGDKDGAKIEDANAEFGFPGNGHELQKSPSSATGILTLSYTSGPSERKISTSSSIGANSYASNFANTTTTTIADETILEEDSKWEFPRHRLRQSVTRLGEGSFGQVWKFEADNIDGNNGSTTVAVKMLKANASESEKRDLLQELAIMKLLEPHPNVVRLLGCCTEKDPIYVIIEYINGGTLQNILKKSRSIHEHNYRNLHGESQSLSSRDLTSFAYQIAKGMAFLASKKVIHRDLAARNILVETNGDKSFSAVDQWKCKIADFGFARDIMANNMYERKTDGRLPIRWMAPETINDNTYTVKSDVWSFGVLMWEIVTLGSTPYVGLGAKEVIKFVGEGGRLPMPKHCKRELYNIMFYCWADDPKERPSWSGDSDSLIENFEKLLLEDTDYIDLNMFPEHEYYNEQDLSGEKV